MGFDALIGSHPHVLEPVDLLTSADGSHQMVCCHSIGNQLSNQRLQNTKYSETEDGLIVNLLIEKTTTGDISLKDMEFIPVWTYHNDAYTSRYTHNDRYFVVPIRDRDGILKALEGELGDQSRDVDASLKRTDAIVGEGVDKIKAALPIRKK